MIQCPNCEKTSSGSSCRLCGWSVAATSPPKPKPAEGYAARQPPSYPEPRPGDDALIRAELAKLHAAPWWRDTQGSAARPAIDPTIRAETDRRNATGPQPVGALVGRVLKR